MRWTRALVYRSRPGLRAGRAPMPRASIRRPTGSRTAARCGRHAGVQRRFPGRPLLRQRLAHHRRDGRDLVAAAEARRRHLVRDRRRVGQARHPRSRSGRGYIRYAFPPTAGLRIARTDFVPDNRRAALYGLMLANPAQTREDRDRQGRRPLRADGRLPVDRQRGPPHRGRQPDRHPRLPGRPARVHRPRHAPRRHAARLRRAGRLHPRARGGRDRRGLPRSADRHGLCRAPTTTSPPSACDDGPHGKGVGGQLRYRVTIGARGVETVWIAVAGSDRGLDDARNELDHGAAGPRRPAARQARRRATSSPRARSSTCPATAGCRRPSTGASRTSPT